MKIDGKRNNPVEATKTLIPETPKLKGAKELKNLESGTKFFSYDQEAGEDEILIVLMKINISWNVRGLNDARKRQLIKSLLYTWKADVYCFQETKLQGGIRNIVRELWANRWVKYAQLEASGTRGGILILWDGRVWEGEICEVGAYCITCKFMGKTMDFSWHMSGGYWLTPSNVVKGDLELINPPLLRSICGAKEIFTSVLQRLDREDSSEWDKEFNNIKQTLLPRLDRFLFSLEWAFTKSKFNFDIWWIEVVEGFKLLKSKLKEWNIAYGGNLKKKKTILLIQINSFDIISNLLPKTLKKVAYKLVNGYTLVLLKIV
ncbi:hypothetical protein H5410_046541 [Solanum commersonii]|uniref:Endonuclease/exonuclease/phosphatase domain-containing protein n=1 Tax=Solanum commersonii TaxID=4109 RepID=A0A9J5XCI3_SOLCO|nr:hypothetical protein H5410_046541 [Solanum commersonii]